MYDENLTPVLEACTADELDPLVAFLTAPTTSLLERDPSYQRWHPEHTRYVSAIVREVRLFGGHTVKDRITGAPGRAWRQVVRDALLELGVKKPPLGMVRMERRVVELMLDSEFDALPTEQQERLRREFYSGQMYRGGLAQHTMLDDFLTRASGGVEDAQLEPDKIKRELRKKGAGAVKGMVKGKLLSSGLKLLARGAAAPLGVGLTAWELLGPAYRITIPVICYIAYLRALHEIEPVR